MRREDERYFDRIESRLDEAFELAARAKQQGKDPRTEIEIPVARDMADRVENILEIEGVAERVRELEGEMSREEAALELVNDFVEGTVGEFDSREGKIEGAVRTAVALLTEGVVAAPIEGIDRVELLTNDDGTEFINVYYAGPIRSAGGTAQALSVLVADYARSLLGIEEYRARSDEIERYAEEIDLYDKETGLQYTPKPKETKFIAKHLPIMLDGEATGDDEVSGFRDLERVDTNSARGGMCLVLAEGIALKAPKIQRYTRELDEVDWPWLQDLIDGTIGADADDGEETTAETDGEPIEGNDGAIDGDDRAPGGGDEPVDGNDGAVDGNDGPLDEDGGPTDGPIRPEPSTKFLRDLIAGRPVFTHPSEAGGFRLRYGRARNHGFATGGVHPATMHLVDDFLATGTQIKTERPGKAHGVVPVDSIEGPTVRLANGDVRTIDDPEEALEIRNGVEKIIDLGEYLVNYGEFVENNHALAPASYVYEWWIQEFEAAGADVQALEDDPMVDLRDPTPEEAIEWASEYDCPLHPNYTYLWHDITVEQFDRLAEAVADGTILRGAATRSDGGITASGADRPGGVDDPTDGSVLAIDRAESVRRTLEALLVEHTAEDDRLLVPDWLTLALSLGVTADLERTWKPEDLTTRARTWGSDSNSNEKTGTNAIEAANEVAPFELRERAPTRIGNRMGRPEKSERRDLRPPVHVLFPLREAGGNQRDLAGAARGMDEQGRRGVLELELAERVCPDCETHTFKSGCPDCGTHTEPYYECSDCGIVCEPDESGRVVCDRCDREVTAATLQEVDLHTEYRSALDRIDEREGHFEILKGVKGLTSSDKVPEPIEKGILRAKHDVSTFKDGTVRYDMTDLPVTAVRPEELDVTAGQFRDLGYETDIDGDPLRHDDQLVELKIQDIVLSDGAAEHMMKTANFVDELLSDFYGLEPFYAIDDRDDLVGELVFGMAPHTSAAVVGRVVGFTEAAAGYAHPYFHAAKRRNCDGDEDCVMLLMDGLLNFSKQYLPDKRGGSVAENSRLVAVDPRGRVRYLTFEELWSELEAPIEVDGKFRKRTCAMEGWRTYAFDENHEASLQPIEKAIRYRADEDETLLRVKTQFGRSIEITPCHSLFRYDDGIEEVAGDDLEAGDLIVAPRSIDIEPTTSVIDVVDCGVVDETDDIGVVDETDDIGVVDETDDIGVVDETDDIGVADETDEMRVTFDGGQWCHRSKPKMRTEDLSNEIPRYIDVDEEFAWLLGVFAAEGSLSGSRLRIQTSDETLRIQTSNETFLKRIERTMTDCLGTSPSVRWSEQAYELAVPAAFERVFFELLADQNSHNSINNQNSNDTVVTNPIDTIVPNSILRGEESIVEAFLQGFIAGEQGESDDSIRFRTTSEKLKDGIVFLLHRLGIVADISMIDRGQSDQRTYVVSIPKNTLSGESGANFVGESDANFVGESDANFVGESDANFVGESDANFVGESDANFVGESDTDLVVRTPEALLAIREMEITDSDQLIPSDLEPHEELSLSTLESIVDELDSRDLPPEADEKLDDIRPLVDGDLSYLRIEDIERVDYDGYLYDLQVGGEPIFTANWLYAHNSMDAPLVMSSRIDPNEIDDEAHNVDIVRQYPLEFYEATLRMNDPEAVEIQIGEDTLGTDDQYRGFDHTHDTTDIHMGPNLSAYKTLGDMQTKMDAQLELARKLRAVDETDVAERVIEYHFLPDLIGNLRAFSRQETRCLDCGEKYRRMPLSEQCRECGGQVNLTVHEGSVNKYMDTATEVAERFGCREYTKQRLAILERSLESIFENDKNKQSGIADFM